MVDTIRRHPSPIIASSKSAREDLKRPLTKLNDELPRGYNADRLINRVVVPAVAREPLSSWRGPAGKPGSPSLLGNPSELELPFPTKDSAFSCGVRQGLIKIGFFPVLLEEVLSHQAYLRFVVGAGEVPAEADPALGIVDHQAKTLHVGV